MPVPSLPSEKVPAPPSPNWTLHSGSSSPPARKASTFFFRVSASAPRSRTMGRSPAMLSTSAANIPPGPKPATTGRSSERRTGTVYSGSSYMARLLLRLLESILPSLSALTATEYSQCISFFFLASSERFVISRLFIARGGTCISRAAFAFSSSSLCPISRRRFRTSIISRASPPSHRWPMPIAG